MYRRKARSILRQQIYRRSQMAIPRLKSYLIECGLVRLGFFIGWHSELLKFLFEVLWRNTRQGSTKRTADNTTLLRPNAPLFSQSDVPDSVPTTRVPG